MCRHESCFFVLVHFFQSFLNSFTPITHGAFLHLFSHFSRVVKVILEVHMMLQSTGKNFLKYGLSSSIN